MRASQPIRRAAGTARNKELNRDSRDSQEDRCQRHATAILERYEPRPATQGDEVIEELRDEAAALGHLRDLLNDQVLNYFAQGGVLLRMKEQQWLADYDSFEELCLREFGFKKSKAYYLMSVYKVLRDHDVSWDEAKSLGWSKLRLICAAAAREDFEVNGFSTRVERAKSTTVAQLALEIKGRSGAKGPGRNKRYGFHGDRGAIRHERRSG
jgi:hypothetical protein